VRDEELPLGRKEPSRKQSEETMQSRWGFRGMTVRDWLQLLIVPLALVVIGLLFSVQQDARQQRIENQRAEAERKLAEQRAQDEALQAYLDQMSTLLLERDLLKARGNSEVITLARARTLTVLGTLDPSRKTQVVRFLMEAELVGGAVEFPRPKTSTIIPPVISLTRANLQGADLSEQRADLNDPRGSLVVTNLVAADLANADLEDADLKDVDLTSANLEGANLRDADLEGVNLDFATLNYANLEDANLEDANFGRHYRADFGLANLKGANLEGAEGVTNEELVQEAETLKGATMPNGQKYEDWLKSKD
jgi:cell division protein FtsB